LRLGFADGYVRAFEGSPDDPWGVVIHEIRVSPLAFCVLLSAVGSRRRWYAASGPCRIGSVFPAFE
jgi:hypothetical protein